jgi:hypothetical protein
VTAVLTPTSTLSNRAAAVWSVSLDLIINVIFTVIINVIFTVIINIIFTVIITVISKTK